MANTTFVPRQTLIESSWLNDVNDNVYEAAGAILGTVSRTVQQRAADFISVKDFGAAGNGTTDDTTAFQAAVTYCATNNKKLWAPAGTYKLSAQVTWTGGLYLVGDGIGQTILSWASGSVTVGLSGTLTSDSYDYVSVEDLTLARFGFGGSAFTLNGAAQIQAGNIQDRFSPRFYTKDVYIRGHEIFSDGFDVGYDVTSVYNVHFLRPTVVGKLNGTTFTYQSTMGMVFQGAGNPCSVTIDSPQTLAVNTSIETRDVEGLVVTQPTLVATQFGIVANNSNPADLQPQVTIKNGHINQSGVGILCRAAASVTISGMFISGISDTPRDTTGIAFEDLTQAWTIGDNTFENTSVSRQFTAISIDDALEGSIAHNVIRRADTGIALLAASSKVYVADNNIKGTSPLGGVTTMVQNLGTNNFIQASPRAYGVFNGTGTPAWVSRYNFDATITDNGTGLWTVTMTQDMANNNYVALGTCNAAAYVSIDGRGTGSFQVQARDSAGALVDPSVVSIIVFGDLA